MSFREKSAWITLVSIIVVAGFYFLHVPWTLRPEPNPRLATALLYCIVAFVVIEVVGHGIAALRAPKDARTPRDERERLIDLRATRIAAYVYVLGTFLAVLTLHHGANAIAVGNGVLMAFVFAEIVNYSTRIVYHRRGF
jgi:hypothetical protein